MKNQEKNIHKVAAYYILGENINVEIKGNEKQLYCLQNLLESSKNLYIELNNKQANLDKVLKLVENKNQLSDEFYNLTGINWKL